MKSYHGLVHGLLSGLLAGGVFAILTAWMIPDTLNKIANLYNTSGYVVGVAIHIIHGGLIGGLFGLIVPDSVSKLASSGYGLLYGLVWWVLGPLVIMPAWLGAGVRLSGEGVQAALPSLPGHLVYGLVLGFLFAVFAHKVREHHEAKTANN
jgi:uncharacterized membrane protein YagU involved in acid resistance